MTIKDDVLSHQKNVLMHGCWRSCTNCVYWEVKGNPTLDYAPESCTRYRLRPPAEIITNGCAGWMFDIPF